MIPSWRLAYAACKPRLFLCFGCLTSSFHFLFSWQHELTVPALERRHLGMPAVHRLRMEACSESSHAPSAAFHSKDQFQQMRGSDTHSLPLKARRSYASGPVRFSRTRRRIALKYSLVQLSRL